MGFVLIKNYVLANPPQTEFVENINQVRNPKISLPDVDWNGNGGQTLVIAVSSTCHFCTESGAFYQRIVKKSGNTRLLAVLPQSVAEGTRYFQSLGVSVNEIRQSPLSAISVTGTPTLMLVDSHGIVTDSWVGKLPAEQEAEVLSKVR
jgi:hypothetical protein